MPFTLMYSSSATFAMDDSEVQVLLARSRERNSAMGITGLLVYIRLDYDRSAFVQVLQGPRDAVEETFARIATDELHQDITVVLRSATEPARFAQWSMKFASVDEPALRSAGQVVGPHGLEAGSQGWLRERAAVQQIVALVG